MRITVSTLRKLPVVTEQGTPLGRGTDVEIDADSHGIVAYLVGSSMRMFGAAFRIVPAEVISITKDQMTVKDTAITAEYRVAARAAPAEVV